MAYITSTSDIKSFLQQSNRDVFGNRTWSNLYSNVGLSQAQAEAQINKQFGQSVGEAYAAASAQRSSIASSNIGQGYREMLNKDLQASLSEAYNSYLSSRSTSLSELSSNVESAYSSIDEALEEQATNWQTYQQEMLNYYDFLAENYSEILLNNDMFAEYRQAIPEYDEEGNAQYDELGNAIYTTDEEGNIQYELMSSKDLLNVLYSTDTSGNKVLNSKGKDFYRRMLNYFAVNDLDVDSFEDYLETNNPDIYKWSMESDPYNYTFTGTNAGSFKEAIGMASTDYDWGTYPTTGLKYSEAELSKILEPYTTSVENMLDKIWDVQHTETLATQAGFTRPLTDEMFETLETIEQTYGLDAHSSDLKSEAEKILKQLDQLYSEQLGGGWSMADQTGWLEWTERRHNLNNKLYNLLKNATKNIEGN